MNSVVDQISGTTPPDGAVQAQDEIRLPAGEDPAEAPGFASRGRMRRRTRFLRKARELAYRDLGGLVFSLHRYGQRNDELVLAKLGTIADLDAQLRELEAALGERRRLTVLREAGITACARCAAIHSSEDRFCPSCGLAMGPNAEVPIAVAAPATVAPAAAPPQQPPQAPTSSAVLTRSFEQPSASPPAAGAPPVPARAGRSPLPPSQAHEPAAPASASAPAPASTSAGQAGAAGQSASDEQAGAEEPTEILRPPAGT